MRIAAADSKELKGTEEVTNWRNIRVISLFTFVDSLQYSFFMWSFWPFLQHVRSQSFAFISKKRERFLINWYFLNMVSGEIFSVLWFITTWNERVSEISKVKYLIRLQLDPSIGATFVGLIMALSGVGEALTATIFGFYANKLVVLLFWKTT